ncbi:MAG: Flp family type IVb pilin [bacterium]
MFILRSDIAAGMIEYGLMIALLTVVTIAAISALSDDYMAIGENAPDNAKGSQTRIARKMLLKNPIPCGSNKDATKGGVQLTTFTPNAESKSIHGVSWCTGDGDGSYEIGNSLNKLSVSYPSGVDPSGVKEESFDVRIDKDNDGNYEKNATGDVSGVSNDESNLVITLTGNYNIEKHDSITFVYTGVNTSNSGSEETVDITINGNAPDAGDETQSTTL